MNTLLKPLKVRDKLLQKKIRTFTVQDFENMFLVSADRTKYFLERQTGEGLLIRLKRGVYALRTDLPSQEEIANSLYRPSYISFEYALAYWGMLPEMPYTITSATTKPTRQFMANSFAYDYSTIKREAYTGYVFTNTNRRISPGDNYVHLSEMGNKGSGIGRFLIAEPEKALVDYLYFVVLGKKELNDRLFIKEGSIDEAKARAYAELFDKPKIITLLGSLL